MFKLLLLVATVALAQGVQLEVGLGSFAKSSLHPKINPRVIGGKDAVAGQVPHQVSLQLAGPLQSAHYCGGSIISPSTILTAGHCVTEVNINPLQHVEVLAGIVKLSAANDAQTSRVLKTITNPNFPGGVAPNDLAIHILATKLVLNQLVQPIALPAQNSTPSGITTLSGWGSTSRTQIPSMPDNLKTVELPIVPYNECQAAVEGAGTPLDETMVCTGPVDGGYGACSGDSGGPLISDDGNTTTLVGVVSWGFIPCGQTISVFTRVSAHLSFINENTVA